MTVSPSAGRSTFLAAEPIHAMIYFTPHFLPVYEAAGLRGRRMGYFASRAAALGAVPADVVIATFFNFNPVLVRRAIPDAWALSSPAAILAARLDAVDASLRQAWGDRVGAAEVAEAADLARVAAAAAVQRPQGRPLLAAHASLDWPAAPHLALWHAQTLLREFRGDGHVALLTGAGLSPVEALVTHAATGQVSAATLRESRGWSQADWQAGVQAVRARGWLEDGDELALSASGRAFRQDLEDRTDELAVAAYAALGEDGSARLRELARPLSQAVIDGGLYRTVTLSQN
ncbi:MAG TPA: hypothetical protein VIJ82_08515 [Streptosporangiaceae bacterium]|jgi:hypothetical protein